MIRRVFSREDLIDLENLLESSAGVVAMLDIHQGAHTDPYLIGLRHDVDDNAGALNTAVKIAEWEHERRFRSTFFLLHTAPYWEDDLALGDAVDRIVGYGHEVGIHANAIAQALKVGGDPHEILHQALNRLRSYGHPIVGMAAHGDRLCHLAGFVNDEQFTECARPEMGEPRRFVAWGNRRLQLEPRPLADFGLEYDTHRLPHGRYLSDSGGKWNEPFPGSGSGQLHVLWHPDWWGRAFISLPVEG